MRIMWKICLKIKAFLYGWKYFTLKIFVKAIDCKEQSKYNKKTSFLAETTSFCHLIKINNRS